MAPSPTIVASVTFLRPEDGGRRRPAFDSWQYRPHLVIGDPSQRVAVVNANRESTEHYLGIHFTGDGSALPVGVERVVSLALEYFPQVDYSGLIKGATFTIREGPKIVGFGCVLEEPPNEPLQPTSGGSSG